MYCWYAAVLPTSRTCWRLRPSYALAKSASGESGGAAVAVGVGAADVVGVAGALLVVVVG